MTGLDANPFLELHNSGALNGILPRLAALVITARDYRMLVKLAAATSKEFGSEAYSTALYRPEFQSANNEWRIAYPRLRHYAVDYIRAKAHAII